MDINTDAKELQNVEEELQVDIVPGTEIMTDVGCHHFVRSKTLSGAERILVPQPSSDPHDPLNWSKFWKTCCILNASWVSFTQGYGPLSLAPMEQSYIKAFDTTLTQTLQFTGVTILVLGFSNFLWVPISSTFGRRPTIFLSQLVNLGSAIWRAKATSYNSFMGASALNGLGAGPGETLQPAIIADLFFLHDRGKFNTLYFLIYFGSLTLGPIVSGPMASNTGWKSFWWLYVAMICLSILMTVFVGPETRYSRLHPARNKKPEITKPQRSNVDQNPPSSSSSNEDPTSVKETWVGRGRPSRSQFGLFQSNQEAAKSLLVNFWTPWNLFKFPIVQFASFVVSWSTSCFLTINLTQAQAFGSPPYNFSQTSIGLCNFSVLVGALIGLATAGPLSDWTAMRATIRNGGIREPEMRLPAMIPYVLIMILGNVVIAVGYQNQWPWAAIVIIGYACIGIQVTSLPAIASTYAVDSYKPVAGALFVSITVNKNLWGYGLSRFLTPWIISSGFLRPIMLNMCLTILWSLLSIIFYYQGKTLRKRSKNSSVHSITG